MKQQEEHYRRIIATVVESETKECKSTLYWFSEGIDFSFQPKNTHNKSTWRRTLPTHLLFPVQTDWLSNTVSLSSRSVSRLFGGTQPQNQNQTLRRGIWQLNGFAYFSPPPQSDWISSTQREMKWSGRGRNCMELRPTHLHSSHRWTSPSWSDSFFYIQFTGSKNSRIEFRLHGWHWTI